MEPVDQPEQIVELLRKYLNGSIHDREAIRLQTWANAKPENQRLMDRLTQKDAIVSDIHLYWDLWNDTEAGDRQQRIYDRVGQKRTTQPYQPARRWRLWIPYAAAIVLMLAVGIYWIYEHQRINQPIAPVAQDVLPGGNRATLILADGRTIDLNSKQSGIIVGNDITYLDGSTILNDTPSGSDKAPLPETLVLKTPIGGNYQVVLPDGSQVWLNANSTLTYPSEFGPDERVVQLAGEAYFQVEHQRSAGQDVPFKVISNGQTVNVLGTAFNISAYTEEPQTRTTLVQGMVEVVNHTSNKTHRITPGQQAVLQDVDMTIHKVDVSKSIAWKNGRFSFDGKSFDQIMREMARWYNLTVVYEGSIPTDQFLGDAFKTDKLGTVLRFLKSSDIRYRVEEGPDDTYRLIINNTGRKEATTH